MRWPCRTLAINLPLRLRRHIHLVPGCMSASFFMPLRRSHAQIIIILSDCPASLAVCAKTRHSHAAPIKKKKICILTNTRQTLLYDADGLFIHCSNMREFATTASTVSTRNEPYHEAIHPVACAIDRSANHTQLAKMSFDDEISTLKLRCPFVNLCKNKKTWHHLWNVGMSRHPLSWKTKKIAEISQNRTSHIPFPPPFSNLHGIILQLELVLFDDALRHLLRLNRLIEMPRGSALLVGVGGSGKQSLTRLASYISRAVCFQITLTKTYNVNSFMEDLRCRGVSFSGGRKTIVGGWESASDSFLTNAKNPDSWHLLAGVMPRLTNFFFFFHESWYIFFFFFVKITVTNLKLIISLFN